MNPWQALSTPLVQRPGHAYEESKQVRKPRLTVPFPAAAIVSDGKTASLVPITVIDFYRSTTGAAAVSAAQR